MVSRIDPRFAQVSNNRTFGWVSFIWQAPTKFGHSSFRSTWVPKKSVAEDANHTGWILCWANGPELTDVSNDRYFPHLQDDAVQEEPLADNEIERNRDCSKRRKELALGPELSFMAVMSIYRVTRVMFACECWYFCEICVSAGTSVTCVPVSAGTSVRCVCEYWYFCEMCACECWYFCEMCLWVLVLLWDVSVSTGTSVRCVPVSSGTSVRYVWVLVLLWHVCPWVLVLLWDVCEYWYFCEMCACECWYFCEMSVSTGTSVIRLWVLALLWDVSVSTGTSVRCVPVSAGTSVICLWVLVILWDMCLWVLVLLWYVCECWYFCGTRRLIFESGLTSESQVLCKSVRRFSISCTHTDGRTDRRSCADTS
jgi:hypothetical protein